MFCLTINGDIEPTLNKECMDIELHDIALDIITDIIVAHQITYIRYFGAFPVSICRTLIHKSLKDYGVPTKYHKQITQDIFRIFKNNYDVKYRKIRDKTFDISLLDDIK